MWIDGLCCDFGLLHAFPASLIAMARLLAAHGVTTAELIKTSQGFPHMYTRQMQNYAIPGYCYSSFIGLLLVAHHWLLINLKGETRV